MKNKRKNGLNLIYDIGSVSVACALVEHLNDSSRVIYVTRQKTRVNEEPSEEDLLQAVSNALDFVTDTLLKEAGKYFQRVGIFRETSIDAVDVVFSAPWIASQTKVAKVEKDKPVIVNERFVENILRMEKKMFEKTLKDNSVFESDKSRDAEEEIIGFKLNGYTTKKPYGKMANVIEIAIYLSYVQKAIVQKVITKTEQNFNVEDVGLHTFPLIAEKYIKRLDSSISEYVLVNVTCENISFSFVKNGTMYDTKKVNCGTNCLIRAVSGVFKVGFDVSRSYIRMNFEGRLDDKSKIKLEKSCEPVSKKIREHFREILKNHGKKNILPKHIFLVSEQQNQEIFKEALENTFEECNADRKLFHIIPINMEKVKKCCSFKQDARSDIFIGMEACYLNTYSQKNN